jgi:hypothetical protein
MRPPVYCFKIIITITGFAYRNVGRNKIFMSLVQSSAYTTRRPQAQSAHFSQTTVCIRMSPGTIKSERRTTYGLVHVCLSVALLLGTKQPAWLPQGAKRTPGTARRGSSRQSLGITPFSTPAGIIPPGFHSLKLASTAATSVGIHPPEL